jgi:hypothetical protein
VSTNCDISKAASKAKIKSATDEKNFERDPEVVGEIKNRDTGYRFSENAGGIVGNGITSA